MSLNNILKEELNLISLSKQEEKDLKDQVQEILKKLSKNKVKAFVGGSLAKGTIIKKRTQDVDVFVVFKDNKELEKLESVLIKENLNYTKLHGSRDYFQIKEDDIVFELIPTLKTKDKVENVTDLSLMHVKYVLDKRSRNKNLSNEIKLAKAFCYSQECYGAESYIKGFSGYSLEVLVIYFGGFVKFLKGIQKETLIDSEKFYKNKESIKQELNENKLTSPVILIDPTYKHRNILAGLSDKTFSSFLRAAKSFLKTPSIKFFEKQKLDIEKIRAQAEKKDLRFIELAFSTNKQEGDIAATKMKKFFEFIVSEFKKRSQKVIFEKFVYESGQDSKGYIVVKENKELELKGPPISLKEAIKHFKQAHKKAYEKKGFIYTKKQISLEEIFNFLKRYEDEMQIRFEILED